MKIIRYNDEKKNRSSSTEWMNNEKEDGDEKNT